MFCDCGARFDQLALIVDEREIEYHNHVYDENDIDAAIDDP